MPVDRGSILMVVYLAFSEAVIGRPLAHVLASRDIGVVIVLDILLLAVVLSSPCSAAACSASPGRTRSPSPSAARRRAWPAACPMANVLFAGQGIGSIVLPLMLFHQIQLMACAVIAQKYAERSRRLAVAAAE